MACFHRRVCGEEALLSGFNARLGEARASGDLLAHELERQKRRMTFIHVEGGRLDAQRAQQPHATHTQEDFLHDARGAVAAVHPEC